MPLPGRDTRIVELRVPGLIGTSGEELLDVLHTVEVAGDGVGQVIRPADRLRRPAPGPMLPALGRTVPRTLEGYLWSRMTSGGAAKATWALLFPFSLANVAYWMLPPVRQDSRAGAALLSLCRALLRVAALLLTMLLVSQVAVVSLDLFAAQCLAPGAKCLPSTPSWIRDSGPVRTALGILPLLAVILVMYRVSSTNWEVKARSAPSPGLPGDDLRMGPDTPVLRCLHAAAALAVVALLPLGGPFRVPAGTGAVITWSAALTLLALTVLAAAVPRIGLGRAARAIVLGIGVALVLASSVLSTPLPPTLSGATAPSPLAGTDGTVAGIGAALVLVCVLFAMLLIPLALLGRSGWRHLPKRLRPWVGGWAAAPALVLACLLGGGFGAGIAVALRKLVNADDLQLPAGYRLITMLWGAAILLAIVLGVLGFAVAVPLRRRRRGIPEIVKLLQHQESEQREAAMAWARSAWERRHLHQVVITVALAMSAGAAALILARVGVWILPGWTDTLATFGVLALGVLAAGLLRIVFTAATSPRRNRHLGALADLVCFWPRCVHPTVPPCYALKVIPEVAARAKTHLADPTTRVVLSGHNLGGLLAVISAARLAAELPEHQRERVGLVTSSTPLQWGYQRAFPAVLPYGALAGLYGELGGRWRGLCRGTDTFGGGVTTWRHQVAAGQLLGVGYLPDGTVGPLPAATPSQTGALVLGGDHWLPDPLHPPADGHRWAAGVRRHTDYLADPEWDRAVAVAAGLERADRPARPLAEQVPLFPDLPSVSRE